MAVNKQYWKDRIKKEANKITDLVLQASKINEQINHWRRWIGEEEKELIFENNQFGEKRFYDAKNFKLREIKR